MTKVPPDYVIAQGAPLKRIKTIADSIGIQEDEIVFYGENIAKVRLSIKSRIKDAPQGSYIVVTGINPTPFGEGKTTTVVGLSQAIGAQMGHKVLSCIRQPSMGPTFGIKGGAAGGGYSQVIPMEEFNLHLTGDIHAVSTANNLLAAAIDTRIFHENTQSDAALWRRLVPASKGGTRHFALNMSYRLEKLGIMASDPEELSEEERSRLVRLDIDPSTITWKRVVDMNDRFLREIEIGLSPTEKGMKRRTGYEISVASEIMAILALSKDLKDLRKRLGDIVFARSKKDGSPITAGDLGVAGAMAVCLKDALNPTLMQTLEGTPVFVHCGPFANIAHGNSSIIADEISLRLVGEDGFVVTEAGFGCDIGMEKFFNIKCRSSGLIPNVAVIVVTIRALKMHGGGPAVRPGADIPQQYVTEDLELLGKGLCNMLSHIQHALSYGVDVCVAINTFPSDSGNEIDMVAKAALGAGAFSAVPIFVHSEGGKGALALARSIHDKVHSEDRNILRFKYFYDPVDGIKANLTKIAVEIYGADGCDFSALAEKQLAEYVRMGFNEYPICVAKTHLSLSDDPSKKGVPKGWRLPVREVKLAAGARFIVCLCGNMMMIPGLPTLPNYYHIDLEITEDGADARVIGLM